MRNLSTPALSACAVAQSFVTRAAAAAAANANKGARRLVTGSLLLVAAATLLHAPAAQAQGTRFSLTCIGTETGSTVNFQYRWGPDDSWKPASVQPGRWQAITYQYRYAGENRAPVLEVRYDDDLSSSANWVRQKINSYAARTRDCEREGFTYNFFDRSGELFLETQDGPTGGRGSI